MARKKRLSMGDILQEERQSLRNSAPSTSSQETSQEESSRRPAKKSDYIRLSITVPPELFDQLQQLSMERRRNKEPYTFCHIVREALEDWFEH